MQEYDILCDDVLDNTLQTCPIKLNLKSKIMSNENSETCFLVWTMVEDTEGNQSSVWDGEFECMTEVWLVAVCDDPVIADAISDSIRALKVWVQERPMNTLVGRMADGN